jgi:nucleoid-associated protein YgaU
MAKTTTTLAGGITSSDWLVNVANKTALRAGDNIVVGTETMKVLVADPATPAIVYRGHRGTNGQAAATGAAANYGPPSDWGAGVGVLMTGVEPFLAEIEAERAAEDVKEAEARAEKAAKEAAKEAEKAAAAAEKAAKEAEKEAAKDNARAGQSNRRD